MEQYVGLDASLKETCYCVIDAGSVGLARGRHRYGDYLTRSTTGPQHKVRKSLDTSYSHPLARLDYFLAACLRRLRVRRARP